MHSVIDHFCGRGNLSYQKYGEIWSPEEWWDMTEDWLQFCKHCVKESLPADEVLIVHIYLYLSHVTCQELVYSHLDRHHSFFIATECIYIIVSC